MQVAGTTRWVPSNGPGVQAKAATWLWKQPETFLLGLQHTNALLREFTLGGESGISAAVLLLKNVPLEVQDLLNEDWQVSSETSSSPGLKNTCLPFQSADSVQDRKDFLIPSSLEVP